MTINLKMPDIKELKPRITVFGIGGAGGNAVNNMIRSGLQGVEFVVANTDSQALMSSTAERLIQMGVAVTEGLGAGSQPDVGRAAAEEVLDEINDHLAGSHMVFVTAGMGGGTGTGAAPVIARAAREHGILTVGVVTKPFHFEGQRRMRVANSGILELQTHVDTLIVIPNQNLFRIANDKTTFADAFSMADQVLYSGVACITDLMVKEGLINLDFADVRSVMREMGKAMMGTGEASGENRAIQAAEAAIANPLLDETTMKGARGLLISITGGKDLTLFEVDEAANRIREEVDPDANIILGATFDEGLEGVIRCSVVATGIEAEAREDATPAETRMAELTRRLENAARTPAAAPRPAAAAPAPVAAPAVARAPEAPRPVMAPAAPVAPRPAAVAAPMAAEAPMRPAAQPVARDPGVMIQPYTPNTAPYAQMPVEEELSAIEAEVPAANAPYIPHAAEVPPQRMPRVEDFPIVAQREMAARRPEAQPQPEGGPMGLLRRLANVGLGRREEEPQERTEPRSSQPARAAAPQPAQQRPVQRPAAPQAPQAPQAPMPRPAAEGEFARRQPQMRPSATDYRPRQAELDPHGRPVPREPRPGEEDHLEIPAFLRRQAN